ncbi:hypothetical protein EGW08_008011 [Elysia chlorotica]|uniref:Uncharacterized protein n=1 Tax=Elysia chlorotica TaxID=188477 RepID=A0A3S1BB96_ELYCH|nr:hypothetical protein EGW08_008011 [Elysia chlorotica]
MLILTTQKGKIHPPERAFKPQTSCVLLPQLIEPPTPQSHLVCDSHLVKDFNIGVKDITCLRNCLFLHSKLDICRCSDRVIFIPRCRSIIEICSQNFILNNLFLKKNNGARCLAY